MSRGGQSSGIQRGGVLTSRGRLVLTAGGEAPPWLGVHGGRTTAVSQLVHTVHISAANICSTVRYSAQ